MKLICELTCKCGEVISCPYDEIGDCVARHVKTCAVVNAKPPDPVTLDEAVERVMAYLNKWIADDRAVLDANEIRSAIAGFAPAEPQEPTLDQIARLFHFGRVAVPVDPIGYEDWKSLLMATFQRAREDGII